MKKSTVDFLEERFLYILIVKFANAAGLSVMNDIKCLKCDAVILKEDSYFGGDFVQPYKEEIRGRPFGCGPTYQFCRGCVEKSNLFIPNYVEYIHAKPFP